MQKKLFITTLTKDTTLNINTFLPVESGQLTVRQDSVGGHIVILGASIQGVTMVGDVPIYDAPNSETLIKWICTDNTVYVYSELSPDYSTIGNGNVDLSNYFTKIETTNNFYPLTSNPSGFITNAALNNYWTRAQSDSRYALAGQGGGGTNDYNQLINKPTIPTNTNQLTNGSGFISSESDTLDSVLSRGSTSNKNMNVSGAVSFNGSLQIPTTASYLPSSIWIGQANSTGSTGGSNCASYLAEMLDVNITSPLASQALVYDGFKWKNTNIVTDLSNVYTKNESNSLFKSINYTPSWSDISGRPTALSQFANDAGYITGFNETDTLNSVLARGNSSALNMSVTGKVSLTGELIIPSTASSSNQSIWIGQANSTGSTGGGSGSSYLTELLDTQITSPLNGQALIFNGSKWVNTTSFSGDYNALINRPTSLSQFINNLGNYGGWLTADGASYAGFASNALDYPYMRHASSGQVIRLLRYDQVGTGAFLNASVAAASNTVVLRDANGYIFNSYINTTDDANSSGLGYIVGKLGNGDNYHRSFTGAAVKSWLAYAGTEIYTAINSAGLDIGVAQMLRWKNYGSNHVIFDASQGTAPNGSAINNTNTTTPWNPTYPTLMGWNGEGTYGVRVDSARIADYATNAGYASSTSETLQSVTDRGNGTNQKIQAAGGSGTAYNTSNIELYGSGRRPTLGFHWAGVVASTLSIESNGRIAVMNNPGTAYENFIANTIYAQGGLSVTGGASATDAMNAQRFIAGYDSGVPNSVNASGWFRALGASGLFFADYGGGLYMTDSTYIRTYGGKQFYCDNEITGIKVTTNNGFKSTTYKGMAGDYDQNAATDKIIWTIGDQWDTIASMYGIGYQYGTKYGNGHSIVFRVAGNVTSRINLETGGANFDGPVYVPNALIIPVGVASNVNGAIWIG